MGKIYLNGNFTDKENAFISPDDRGFLFADGVYEVVRWYRGGFYDMEGHMLRLKRSLSEIRLTWNDYISFPATAHELIRLNDLGNKDAMVYLQVTRGAARRTHYFPGKDVMATAYSYAFEFQPDEEIAGNGIEVLLKEDIRWSRCDIKSISLLANTMSFQEAYSQGMKECIFVRNGLITEGSHSNIFFVRNNMLFTHPESCFILSGISRKNTVRIAARNGIEVNETALNEKDLPDAEEAFITNTSSEITPVIKIGGITIGNGTPGPVTRYLQEMFRAETNTLKSQ